MRKCKLMSHPPPASLLTHPATAGLAIHAAPSAGAEAEENAPPQLSIIDPYIIGKLSLIKLNIYEAALDREEREVHT